MVSSDLEKSLRDAVGRHLDERLGGLQAEVARLQTQINDALATFGERLGDTNEASAGIASAISEHLHTAYTQGIEEAATKSVRARASSDVALIKAAIDDIDNQRTQTDILNALVNRAASFAPRVAFFIVKSNRATGWRARGLEGTVGDNAVRELSLALDERTLLSECVESKQTWSGPAGAHDGDAQIWRRLGGDNAPERLIAVPLVARGRAVAALYADSADLDSDAINLEALETLVRVAGMAVELLAMQRPAPVIARTPPAPQPFVPPPPTGAPEPHHSSTQPFEHTPPVPTPAPQMERHTPAPPSADEQVIFAPPLPSMPSPSAPPPPAEATPADISATTSPAQPHTDLEPPAEVAPAEAPVMSTGALSEPSEGASFSTPPVVSPVTETTEAASFSDAMPTPAPSGAETDGSQSRLGGARQYGRGVAADLPIEVADDEEKRLHNDARRFARLLVSEIKLYNEQKVREGRAAGNIYPRLREEIDRSREMYDKRVRPEVAARYDYFHTEIVNTLAEGDPAKLGDGYPGVASV